MTTTARIAATSAEATYTASIAAGAVGNFAAPGLGPNESVNLLGSDGAGAYSPMTYIDEGGSSRTAKMTKNNSTIQIIGPLDFRFAKTLTSSAVELSEYT